MYLLEKYNEQLVAASVRLGNTSSSHPMTFTYSMTFQTMKRDVPKKEMGISHRECGLCNSIETGIETGYCGA